jgi:hypothetical protein
MSGRMLSRLVSVTGSAALIALIGVTAADAQSDGIMSTKRKIKDVDSGVVTLCHATRSETNPYESVTVSDNGKSHAKHFGDISPAPAMGCPSGGTSPTANPEPVTMLLFGAGLSGVGYIARRRRAKQNSESD